MTSRWMPFLLATPALAAVFYAGPWAAASSAGLPLEQEPEAATQDGQKDVIEQLRELGVRLDLERKLIEIDAEICQDREPLEYLLVTERGKDHEALLRCNSVSIEALNAAMLLLGVEPGANYRSIEVDPPPTPEEFEAGAPLYEIEHPKGDSFYLYVSWEEEMPDGSSRTRFYRAEDLVVNVQEERTYQRGPWVYLGSRMIKPHKDAKEFFAAEGEGNVISVVYFSPANHLMTGSDPMAENQYVWFPNIFLMPEIGAPVRLLFSQEDLDQAPPSLSETKAETAE